MVGLIITVVLMVVFFAFWLYMWARIERVAAYRNGLIDKIYTYPDWRWRQEVFDTVSFDTMLYKFWKPINSFYPDKSFVESGSMYKQIGVGL